MAIESEVVTDPAEAGRMDAQAGFPMWQGRRFTKAKDLYAYEHAYQITSAEKVMASECDIDWRG